MAKQAAKADDGLKTRDWSEEKAELADLNGRRDRLSKFMEGSDFPNFSLEERERMQRQHQAMSSYAQVLSERISSQ